MGQQDDRQLRVLLLQLFTEGIYVHVGQPPHGDHQIKPLPVQVAESLFRRGDPGETGWFAETQALVFVNEPFRQPAVFFHDAGIVESRNQEDLPDLLGH